MEQARLQRQRDELAQGSHVRRGAAHAGKALPGGRQPAGGCSARGSCRGPLRPAPNGLIRRICCRLCRVSLCIRNPPLVRRAMTHTGCSVSAGCAWVGVQPGNLPDRLLKHPE